jgi:hypothetical protein
VLTAPDDETPSSIAAASIAEAAKAFVALLAEGDVGMDFATENVAHVQACAVGYAQTAVRRRAGAYYVKLNFPANPKVHVVTERRTEKGVPYVGYTTVPNLDLVERGMQVSITVKLCAFIPAGNTTKQVFTIQCRAQSCSLVRRRKPLHAPVAVDVSELDGFDVVCAVDSGNGACSGWRLWR